MPEPVILDGDESEWKDIPEDVAEEEDNVVKGIPDLAQPWLPQRRGREDLSFSVKYIWRKNDGIYMLIKVKDDKPMTVPPEEIGRAFLWDCLELFFDSRPYGKRDRRYRKSPQSCHGAPLHHE